MPPAWARSVLAGGERAGRNAAAAGEGHQLQPGRDLGPEPGVPSGGGCIPDRHPRPARPVQPDRIQRAGPGAGDRQQWHGAERGAEEHHRCAAGFGRHQHPAR
ncbi:hypothetical protein G6F66_014798 [Rhizopus arrhizus]|nr:hypothetical protein G6F66_014798 [Rhizopus arrhizus]